MKRLISILLAVVATFVLSTFIADAFGQSAFATLTLKNNSKFKVNLYVGGEYKCTAEPWSSCKTKNVLAWINHKISARVDGEEVTNQHYQFEEGEVRTWTVGFKEN